jgi:hypothetical protein
MNFLRLLLFALLGFSLTSTAIWVGSGSLLMLRLVVGGWAALIFFSVLKLVLIGDWRESAYREHARRFAEMDDRVSRALRESRGTKQ